MKSGAPFYAVANVFGAVTIRLEADSVIGAKEQFLSKVEVYDLSSDADEDLGTDGEMMAEEEFEEVMQLSGYEIVDNDMRGNGEWKLWRKNSH